MSASGTAVVTRERRTVAGPDIHHLQLRIVDDRIPGATAAPELPPLTVPGVRSPPHGLVFETLSGIPRHDIEAPQRGPGLCVPRADEAPRAKIGAPIADDDFAIKHPGRTGDRVGRTLVEGLRRPDRFARARVE